MSDAVDCAKAASTVMALDVLYDAVRCRTMGLKTFDGTADHSQYFLNRSRLLVNSCDASSGFARGRARGSSYYQTRLRLLREKYGAVDGIDELQTPEPAPEVEEAPQVVTPAPIPAITEIHGEGASGAHSRGPSASAVAAAAVGGERPLGSDIGTPITPTFIGGEECLEFHDIKPQESMLLPHEVSDDGNTPRASFVTLFICA